MDVLIDRCAALDVHKDQVTADVRRWAADGRRRENETRTFSTMLHSLHDPRRWLVAEGVTRKDSFVPPTHPGFQKFARLTRQEERAGLLDRADIGRRLDWLAVLSGAGYRLRGHRLEAELASAPSGDGRHRSETAVESAWA